jgi:hypothetical protein
LIHQRPTKVFPRSVGEHEFRRGSVAIRTRLNNQEVAALDAELPQV